MTNEKFKEWLKSLDDKQLRRVLAAVNGEMLTRTLDSIKERVDNGQEAHASTFSLKDWNKGVGNASFDDPTEGIINKVCRRLDALERDMAMLKISKGQHLGPFRWYPDTVIY